MTALTPAQLEADPRAKTRHRFYYITLALVNGFSLGVLIGGIPPLSLAIAGWSVLAIWLAVAIYIDRNRP